MSSHRTNGNGPRAGLEAFRPVLILPRSAIGPALTEGVIRPLTEAERVLYPEAEAIWTEGNAVVYVSRKVTA